MCIHLQKKVEALLTWNNVHTWFAVIAQHMGTCPSGEMKFPLEAPIHMGTRHIPRISHVGKASGAPCEETFNLLIGSPDTRCFWLKLPCYYHNIIQIHNTVLQDWQYSREYFQHSDWMWKIQGIFLGIHLVPIKHPTSPCPPHRKWGTECPATFAKTQPCVKFQDEDSVASN